VPCSAAVVAAAVLNRWGDTSTPIVSSVILEIRVPRFLVVYRRPVREEIQREFVAGREPIKAGRDSVSIAGRRRRAGIDER
jgi:hypothetical protein